jgi:AraC-like DNA-binding protein
MGRRPIPGEARNRTRSELLTDQEMPLEEPSGEDGRRLLAGMTSPASTAGRIRILERWLLRRLQSAARPDAGVRAVVRQILAQGGQGCIGELVRGVGPSERQMRRRFEAAVGVGPKCLARIVRLQRAVRHGRAATSESWATIAIAAGTALA